MSITHLSKGDSRFLLQEFLAAERQIKSGNSDRYVAGRKTAFESAICYLLKVDASSFKRYIDFVHDQMENKNKRLAEIEEPVSWIRRSKS